jgi:sugar (pentulose or hexulose) kinase
LYHKQETKTPRLWYNTDIMNNYLAIDIGASSGRHIIGSVKEGKITLEEVYRFDNSQITRNGHECWDIESLVASVKAGIDAALGEGACHILSIRPEGGVPAV